MTDPRGYIGTKTDTRDNVVYTTSGPVHNYFPDGSADNADLIDDGSYASGKFWFKNMGGETITQVDETAFRANGHAIQCVTSGSDWEDGLVAGDVMSTLDPLPAGHYWFGCHLRVASGAVWGILKAAPQGNGIAARAVRLTSNWQRFTLPVVVDGSARPNLSISLDQDEYPDEPTPLVATIQCCNVMLSDGRVDFFADGDSDGWAWTGTPHASASYGPQP